MESDFIKACIKRTFADDFIAKISFEIGSKFNDSCVLRYLIGKISIKINIRTIDYAENDKKILNNFSYLATVQKKYKGLDYDDKEARQKIVASFKQFRNTKSRQKK